MRIVFMGTPEFACPILEALNNLYEVSLVVTQPDKPVGRRHILEGTPVKKKAELLGLEVFQPEKIKTDYQRIIDVNPDLIITAAYGQLIPEFIINLPRYRSINVHASLLPKYRGGSPIHRAIINGDAKTGVTIMYMAKRMDAGDILAIKEIPILDSDNVLSMFEKLSILGRDLLLDVLPKIIDGSIKPIKQNEEEVSFAYNITHDEEKIDWNKTRREIFNKVRGMNPWPICYSTINDTNVKIFEVSIGEEKEGIPGCVLLEKKRIGVFCKDGIVYLEEIQVSGKKKTCIKEFLNGQHLISSSDKFI